MSEENRERGKREARGVMRALGTRSDENGDRAERGMMRTRRARNGADGGARESREWNEGRVSVRSEERGSGIIGNAENARIAGKRNEENARSEE